MVKERGRGVKRLGKYTAISIAHVPVISQQIICSLNILTASLAWWLLITNQARGCRMNLGTKQNS
jgi:hypothetical protein